MNAPTRRLFFALWPDDQLRGVLAIHAGAAVQPFKCKPVPADNLHVTLAFLGSVASSRLDQLIEIGKHVHVIPCVASFDRLVVWHQARVLALATSQTPAALALLVSSLQRQLAAAGFNTESRPYRAHITLAREVRAAAIENEMAAIAWPVNDFVLVESTPVPRGSCYEVIATF